MYCNDCLCEEETKKNDISTLLSFLSWLCSAVVHLFVFPSPPCFLWPWARLRLRGPRPAALHWQRRASSPGQRSREERRIGKTAPERQRTPYCDRLDHLTKDSAHVIKSKRQTAHRYATEHLSIWSAGGIMFTPCHSYFFVPVFIYFSVTYWHTPWLKQEGIYGSIASPEENRASRMILAQTCAKVFMTVTGRRSINMIRIVVVFSSVTPSLEFAVIPLLCFLSGRRPFDVLDHQWSRK